MKLAKNLLWNYLIKTIFISSLVIFLFNQYIIQSSIIEIQNTKNYLKNTVTDKKYKNILPNGATNEKKIEIINFINEKLSEIIIKSIVPTFLISFILVIFLYRKLKKTFIEPLKEINFEIIEINGDFMMKEEKNNDIYWTIRNSFLNMKKKLVEYEKKLENLIYNDFITDMPNRLGLYQKYNCDNFLRNHKHCEGRCVKNILENVEFIYLINIDDLSFINYNFGNHVGDSLIIELGNRLKCVSKQKKMEIYKFSGDEFVIVIPKREKIHPEEIMKIFKDTFKINEHILFVTASVGISGISEKYFTLNQMIKNADIAMRKVKSEGKNGFLFFEENLLNKINKKFDIEKDLKIAIKESQFQLNYQPQVDILHNKIIGFEALLRWNHPVKGFIPPMEFIEITEKTGLIVPLGKWIFRTASNFIKNVNKSKNTEHHVSVNISIVQVMQEDFVEFIENTLVNDGINPKFIQLEITESILIEYYEIVVEKLKYLKSLGIRIDLDDFGTGYSSLNYLKTLPIDALKIDKSFVDEIFSKNCLIPEIISIAKRINIKTVAEGVETKEQLEKLKEYGCNVVQGYYISKPMNSLKVADFLENY